MTWKTTATILTPWGLGQTWNRNPELLKYIISNVQFSTKKFTRYSKRHKSVTCTTRKKTKTKTKTDTSNYFEVIQMLDLADKDFKAGIINMFKELKESMSREFKGVNRIMFLPIKNVNKEIGIIKLSQIEVKKLKNMITEMKISLESFKNTFYLAEKKRMSKFEDIQ